MKFELFNIETAGIFIIVVYILKLFEDFGFLDFIIFWIPMNIATYRA